MLQIPSAENRNCGRLLIVLCWLAAAAIIGILLHYLPWHLLQEAIRRIPATTFLSLCVGIAARKRWASRNGGWR